MAVRPPPGGFLRFFLRILGISAIFGAPTTILFVPPGESMILAAFCFTTAFAVTVATVSYFVLPRLQFPSFLATVVATAAAYWLMIVIGIHLGLASYLSLDNRLPPWHSAVLAVLVRSSQIPGIAPGSLAAFLSMAVVSFLVGISRKLGPGVMGNWLMGYYHQPRLEQRVFLFLDLRGSTTLAEQMGDLNFSRLLQWFFEDLSRPVTRTGGEVSHYIGDEAVLTWKLEKGVKDANCLRCFFLFAEEISARQDQYLKEFGVVPGFKAGAHVGQVVATQVGEIKSEIVFHGDVLNTAARIQGMCTELGEDFLVSEELARLLEGKWPNLVPLGVQALKGKEQPIALFAARR